MIKVYEKEQVRCVEGVLEETRSKVFVYLVDGMLIDTGAEKLQKELIGFFTEQQFDQVVLTHYHEDHTGNAARIQQNCGVPVFIHPLGLEIIKKYGDYPDYRIITWGNRLAFDARPLGDHVRSRTLDWQVIHTPGHADDHIALFHEASGRLFTGDLFVSPKTRVMMTSESLPLIAASLRTFEDGLDPTEIDLQLFQKFYPIIQFSKGEWDTIHIVASVLAAHESDQNQNFRPCANT